MPGPRDSKEALAWAQVAMQAGRYILHAHFEQRVQERAIDLLDAKHAVEAGTRAEPYTRGSPCNGGTCWRIFGQTIDQDRELAIGVETFLDHKKRRVILVTVFDPSEP